MDTFAFWLPLIFLFASALIGTVLKRRAKDHCLKKFEGYNVILPSLSGKMVEGTLNVYAQGIQVVFPKKIEEEVGTIDSFILHPAEIDKIPLIIRPAPDPDTRDGLRWKEEMQKILYPNIWYRTRRIVINFYNMLKDAFGQAAKAIIGAISKDSSISKVKDSSKRVEEVRSGISELVPNSWEPILEKYRGRKVVVERQGKNATVLEAGLLEDYSSKYLLVRGVKSRDSSLVADMKLLKTKGIHGYDMLFSRKVSIIRNTLAD